MAKPSVTNIRPPTTPPKTAWDLNSVTDQGDANYHVNTGSSNDAFDTTVLTLNIPAHGPAFDYQDYGYVFYGVNGGMDETILGNDAAAGVIVSGNGKDHVTGGQWDDAIMSGNGADVDHGGGGNDIIFGENGPDKLYGDADDGTANFVAPDEGQIINPGNVFLWDHDPNGESVTPATSPDDKINKEGAFIDDNSVVHNVFSFTPGADGTYTIAYYQNGEGPPHLDGPGEPDPDYFTVDVLAGNTYYYSFVNSSTQPIFVAAFGGNVVPPAGDAHDSDAFASSQAYPNYDLTVIPGEGQGVAQFTAGDQLIGGNGPDQFIWNANDGPQNVDVIWDFNQSSGAYDPLEGDQLIIQNTGLTLADLTAVNSPYVQKVDLDNNVATADDVVIFVSQDHAIGLIGVHDINTIAGNITIS